MIYGLVIGVKGGIIIGFFCWLFTQLLRREDAKWIWGAPTIVMVGTYVLGAISFNIWLFDIALLLMIPALAKSRAEAIALYPIAIVACPQMTSYLMLGSSQLVAVDKWVVLSASLVMTMYMHPKRGRNAGYLDAGFAMLFILECIQIRGMNLTSMVRTLATPACLAIPYIIISRNLHTVEQVRRVFLSLTFVGFVLGGVAVVEMKGGWLLYQSLYETLHVPVGVVSLYSKGRGGMIRAPTSFGDSTSFGLFLAFAMMYTMATRDIFRKKRNWLVTMGLIFAGIMAANSRNTLVALAIGLPLYDLYRKRYASLGAKAALLGLAYVTLLMLAEFSQFFAGLVGSSQDTAGTGDYRRMLFQRGMEEVSKHPLMGMNMGDAMAALQDMKQGEGIVDLVNGYVAYALSGGYPALLMTFLMFAIPVMVLFTRRRKIRFDVRLQRFGAAIFSIAAFSTVTTFFTGFGSKGATFYAVAIALGTAILNVKPPRPNEPVNEQEEQAPPLIAVNHRLEPVVG